MEGEGVVKPRVKHRLEQRFLGQSVIRGREIRREGGVISDI